MRATLIAMSLLLALPAGGQIYKWTDPTGKVVYGDQPPQDAKKQEIRVSVPAVPDARVGVTMYSTDWCGHCRNARTYFAAKGIRYRDIDVEKSEAGRREFKRLGGGGVPLIIIGDKSMRGFSAERFEELAKGS